MFFRHKEVDSGVTFNETHPQIAIADQKVTDSRH